MILNYFKSKNRPTDNEDHTSTSKIRRTESCDDKSHVKGEVPVTTLLKTVKKWAKKLNIDLDYEFQIDKNGKETYIVCKVWCNICKNPSSDKTSSVSFYSPVQNI